MSGKSQSIGKYKFLHSEIVGVYINFKHNGLYPTSIKNMFYDQFFNNLPPSMTEHIVHWNYQVWDCTRLPKKIKVDLRMDDYLPAENRLEARIGCSTHIKACMLYSYLIQSKLKQNYTSLIKCVRPEILNIVTKIKTTHLRSIKVFFIKKIGTGVMPANCDRIIEMSCILWDEILSPKLFHPKGYNSFQLFCYNWQVRGPCLFS